MPKAEIPVGYAQAVAEGTYGPATWDNVFYFSVDPEGVSDLGLICADIGWGVTELYNKIGYAHFSENWTHHLVRVKYRDASADIFKRTTIADATGSNESGDQDAQVSYLFNWDVPDIRRGGKARTYVCGVPMDACADSAMITSDFLGAINSGLEDWFTELGDGSSPGGTVLGLVMMSFVDNGVDIDPPVPYPSFSGVLNHVVATQRRRVDRLR